jgi:hypothetical protein
MCEYQQSARLRDTIQSGEDYPQPDVAESCGSGTVLRRPEKGLIRSHVVAFSGPTEFRVSDDDSVSGTRSFGIDASATAVDITKRDRFELQCEHHPLGSPVRSFISSATADDRRTS